MLTVFLVLVFAHFLADYPLQGDFLSRAKNRRSPIPDVPWYQAMGAHAFIHAGLVAFVTDSLWMAGAEFLIHFITDDAKCRKKLSYNADQAIHILCKFTWAYFATYGI